jgi:murein DD-endopeptidase MepM/ murein hydrolase activator NlpD
MDRLRKPPESFYKQVENGVSRITAILIRGCVSAWVAKKGLYTLMKRSFLASRQSLVRNTAFAVTAAFALSAATVPANASSAATASDSFRVSPEDVKANKSALGVSDPDFRALHDNWGSLSGASAKSHVAIPSINPTEIARVSSGFGSRSAPMRGASRNHKGLDLPGAVGTPIYATADGVVGRAEWVRGYGKYIELEHGNEIETRYGHMSALNVYAGQRVHKGDVIGYMGSTGNSTGSHLHYEVRLAGEAVNPMSFLAPMHSANELQASSHVDMDAVGGPAE